MAASTVARLEAEVRVLQEMLDGETRQLRNTETALVSERKENETLRAALDELRQRVGDGRTREGSPAIASSESARLRSELGALQRRVAHEREEHAREIAALKRNTGWAAGGAGGGEGGSGGGGGGGGGSSVDSLRVLEAMLAAEREAHAITTELLAASRSPQYDSLPATASAVEARLVDESRVKASVYKLMRGLESVMLDEKAAHARVEAELRASIAALTTQLGTDPGRSEHAREIQTLRADLMDALVSRDALYTRMTELDGLEESVQTRIAHALEDALQSRIPMPQFRHDSGAPQSDKRAAAEADSWRSKYQAERAAREAAEARLHDALAQSALPDQSSVMSVNFDTSEILARERGLFEKLRLARDRLDNAIGERDSGRRHQVARARSGPRSESDSDGGWATPPEEPSDASSSRRERSSQRRR